MHLVAVVDDEEPVRRSMRRLLRAAGYDVALFASGTEFLASLDRRRPACVLVDGNLPDMHGREVLTRLTGRASGVPAIVVTGNDTPDYRRAAAALGAVAFFAKPFDPAALLPAVAAAVTPDT